MLLRQCRIHNVPIACNRYSADLMITSSLWDAETYIPTTPKYEKFDRDAYSNEPINQDEEHEVILI
jgi:methylglyoxal synthase